MSQAVIKQFESNFVKTNLPDVKVGQTVEVETIIRDQGKQRIQKFRGLVIRVKGTGATKNFTVRKISYGVGVEKTLPLNSQNVAKIKILKYEPVRRSKLYFMRNRVGKAAMRVRKGRSIMVPQEGTVQVEEEVVENTTTSETPAE